MPLSWLQKKLITTGINAGAAGVGYAYDNWQREKARNHPPLPQQHYHRHHHTFHTNQIKADTKDKDVNLTNCLSFFKEGMEMLTTSLHRISFRDQHTETTTEATTSQQHELARRIEISAELDCVLFTADIDKLKSIPKESFAWAKSSFKAARDDATRAFNNKALSVDNRLLAAKVRILSTIFGCLDEPETAAAACKVYLKELNTMSCISDNLREIINKEKNSYKKTCSIMTLVAQTNYYVFHFTEMLARNVINVHNWPRLIVPSSTNTLSLHPIRSVGLRTLIEEIEESKYGIDPKSISLSEPIDATDLAVSSSGQFVVAGLDSSKNTVVYVYNNSGEFQFAVSPTEEELNGREFQPCAVFTDEKDNIYVHPKAVTKASRAAEEAVSLFVFSKEGRLQRVVSVERGFMALEKKTGKIFISNRKGVSVYKSSGELLRSFIAPEALQGSACPVALYDENTVIQTDIHDQNVYLVTDTGRKVRQFQVKQARGWKYVAFNSISGEIIVSYLSKDLMKFHLDAYLKNGQLLGTIDLPSEHSSHPRSVTITPSGRIAILYENIVHLI